MQRMRNFEGTYETSLYIRKCKKEHIPDQFDVIQGSFSHVLPKFHQNFYCYHPVQTQKLRMKITVIVWKSFYLLCWGTGVENCGSKIISSTIYPNTRTNLIYHWHPTFHFYN